jgi:hypothetical protein
VPLYLDEFVFRFNRRSSRHRGMVFFRLMEMAVNHEAVHYEDLVFYARPKRVQPQPPAPATRSQTRSITRPTERRPWRTG